jgi:Domain of unknown function (DUF4129)
MSSPALDLPAQRPDLRPWLTVLIPFTALGLLPWWVCLALSISLALARLNDDSRSVAPLLVLLAAVAVSLPMLLSTAPDRLLRSGNLFAQAAPVGLLALACMRALEHGQRRGLLLPVAALLLFPSPGGLLALLLTGLGLSGAENRPRIRLAAPRLALIPLLGAALLIAGAALLIGHAFPAAPVGSNTARSQPVLPKPRQAQPPPVTTPPVIQGQAPGWLQKRIQTQRQSPFQDLALLRSLVPVTGLLILLCIALLLRNIQLRQSERRSGWTDYLAVASLLGTLFMLLVLGAGAGPGGFLDGPPPAAQAPAGGTKVGAVGGSAQRSIPGWITPLLNAGIVFATLFFTAVAVYLYLALRAEKDEGTLQPLFGEPQPGASEPLPPLHRVRLTWRELEGVLTAAGLARMSSETPEEYSARLGTLFPDTANDLHTLTRLYLPVRYGGELSEADATQAEASAEAVQQMIQTSQRALPTFSLPLPFPHNEAP